MLVWRLLNCCEFQRLRRIRQLGFSEFVYPGATHTRFSHSVGVFHNARRLLGIIEALIGRDNYHHGRALVASAAALLHDLGHGPFSHTFEGVAKTLKRKKKHEEWSVDIIQGDTEVNRVLVKVDKGLPQEIATLIKASEPKDIYASVVSSQFDADRLDYLVRDRYMTGVGIGDFDLEWLLDCLRIDQIFVGGASDLEGGRAAFLKAPGFVLDEKGFKAAEGYLQARYQLYSQVYLHKTTRAAEKMLDAILRRLATALKDGGGPDAIGIPAGNPVVIFLSNEEVSLANYLALDDTAVWALLADLQACKEKWLAQMAERLLKRHLFKCIDIGRRLQTPASDEKLRFQERLYEQCGKLGLEPGVSLLEDDPSVTGYSWYSWGNESTLKKVLFHDKERNTNIDIGDRSDVVKALKQEQFYRLYVPDKEARESVEQVWKGAGR